MQLYRILVINPGSTSTKIAVYENDKSIFLKTLRHDPAQLDVYNKIADQYHFRKEAILHELENADIDIHTLSAVVGRGGMVKPIQSGVYEVNEALKTDLHAGIMGEHASNLGGLIADDIAQSLKNVRAFIADPVVVDELEPVARITGHPDMPRRSVFHALNQKAVARNYAKSVGKRYEDCNIIVAHMGGGISVGTHKGGRVIDVNNALDGYGPFSPERCGTLPTGALVNYCFSGNYTHDQMKKIINGKGGLMAHLGTNQAHEAAERALAGDEYAKLVLEAMAYQVAKTIGGAATVLHGKVDVIIITGGIANNKFVLDYIVPMISFISNVLIFPGEDEMKALNENALGVLTGERHLSEYK